MRQKSNIPVFHFSDKMNFKEFYEPLWYYQLGTVIF